MRRDTWAARCRRGARRGASPSPVAVWAVALAAAAAWLGGGAALRAQAVCQGSNISYFGGGNDSAMPAKCSGSFVCQLPIVTSGPTYALDSGCDPTAATCGMTVTIGMHFTGNHVNSPFFNFGYSFEEVDLLAGDSSLLGECGYAGEELQPDFGTVIVTGSVHCGVPSTYTVNLISCPTANCPGCPPGPVPAFCMQTAPLSLDLAGHAGCPAPPPDACSEGGGAGGGFGGGGGAGGGAAAAGGGAHAFLGGGSGDMMAGAGSKGNGPDSGAAGTSGGGQCQRCQAQGSSSGDGSGCGFSVGGGGASCVFKAAGAHLRYAAGGVGGPGWPGSSGVTANPWNATLGRYWSHDYAERDLHLERRRPDRYRQARPLSGARRRHLLAPSLRRRRPPGLPEPGDAHGLPQQWPDRGGVRLRCLR